MTKSKVKALFISFFLAAVVICLSLAFVACKGGDKDGGNYGVGEEGVYYYDKDASTEYLMTLQSGTYMISAEGAKSYAGTYSYSESDKSISFKTDGGEGFAASFSDDAMQLAIENTPYTFLKKVNYTVTFVDGNTSTTQSVTYGKQAAAPGKDESRIFIGWFTDSAFTSSYKFDTAVTGDLTLYAYYIDIDATIANYDVTFIDGGETVYETKTQNGVVYDIPDYEGILGWWVSDTNEEDSLTYRYERQTLNEATKLFAVKEGSLGVSVYEDKITWEATVSSVSITVDGVSVTSSATGNSFAYDFSSLGTGAHEVLVRASGYGDENLVFVVNGLARVSNFSVYGNVLVYNAVENAQYYYVSVTCGNPSHDHTMVYNGNTLTYDFSNCEMGKDGISFTVYAYAAGYVESVSETFVYSLALDGTTVKIDSATDTATWTAVQGASGYEVYIDGEYVDTVTGTEYSFKYYDINTEVAISVKPVAPGYYSEVSEEASYKKSTLRTPEITGINAYTVSWSYVKEATNYIIYVNGKQFETVSGDITSYALKGDSDFTPADSYVITVRAVNAGNTNQNSQLSDEVFATDGELAELLVYDDGVVYWQYAMAAGTYYVSVNDGDETTVEGKNYFDVTFTQSGENVIKVWFTTEAGEKSLAQLSVTAYAVIFNSEGGSIIDTIYVAKGDTLKLDIPVYESGVGDFLGWYTLPNPNGLAMDTYMGEGVEIASGSVFSGNSTLILYACWEVLRQNVTLVVGNYGNIDGETKVTYAMPVNVSNYEVTVPTATDAAYVFYGWYSESDGRGTRYTNYDGTARTVYNNTNVTTLYAYWIQVLDFEVTTYAGEKYAEVKKGSNISLAPNGEVTVPSVYTIDGEEYTVGIINSAAFNSCSTLVTLNIPDTIIYISTTNNGHDSGTGAFASNSRLEAVNVYATGEDVNSTREIIYYSDDNGLLYKKTDDGVELIYYPYGKTDTALVIAEYVSNEWEYDVDGTTKIYRPVTQIAQKVLYNNTTITSVTIPATVTEIGIQAFQSCTKLTTVTFNNTVTNTVGVSAADTLAISEKAFQSCSSLTSVELPARLGEFDATAFNSCRNFTTISIASGSAIYASDDGMLYSADYAKIVFCPRGRTATITWHSGVTTIGESAFEDCINFTAVEIPTSVSKIEKSAFEACTGLTSITFADRTNAQSIEIGERAFYGCTYVTGIILPVNVVTIGSQAFAGCTRLTYVKYDCVSGTTAEQLNFAEGAFGTTVETLEFGQYVPLIENFVLVFGGQKLKEVIIDGNNTNYIMDDSDVIYGINVESTTILIWSPTLSGAYTTNSACNVIGAEAFMNMSTLTSITITAAVTEIQAYAFYKCNNLRTVTFASDSALTTIGDYAFAGTGLSTITLPASLQYMGEYEDGELVAVNVFDSCTALTAINVAEGNQYFASSQGVLYMVENGTAAQLIVSPVNNSETAIEVPSSVTKIWDKAFYNNTTIKSIKFTNGEVTGDIEFGESVFTGCTSLEEADLPTGLETIPKELFANCTSLKSVVIPYTVTTVGGNAFYHCNALATVTFDDIPAGSQLSDYPLTFEESASMDGSSSHDSLYGVFYLCTSLKEIALPDRTVTLSVRMLKYCSALKKVTIGANVTSLPNELFYACYDLQEVSFGNSSENPVKLTKIEDGAFDHCGDDVYPMNLVLPSSVTEIGDRVFVYCRISSITFNEGLESVGSYLFCDNYASDYEGTFTTINIPSTLTSMGSYAFTYCTTLQSVTFAEGSELKAISEYAFNGCTALTTISVPAGVEEIGSYAFNGCTALTTVTFLTETDSSDGNYQRSSVAKFGDYVFQNCKSLEYFAFPETGADITLGQSMFKGCTALTKIKLSSGMTTLGFALNNCYSITEIDTTESNYFEADETAPVLYSKTETGGTKTIVYVYGDITGEFYVPDEVTAIADSAFVNQVTLTAVSFPVTITDIGDYAFDGCFNLREISFRGAQTGYTYELTIGAEAFRQTKVANLDFSDFTSVEIGAAAFAYSGIETLTLTQNIELTTGTGTTATKLGTFAYCTNLETVILNGVTEIPKYTFYGCEKLRTIASNDKNIDDGVAHLEGVSVKAGSLAATGLEKVKLSSESTIEASSSTSSDGAAEGAFQDCTSLTTVLMGGYTSTGRKTFYGCTSLVSLGATEEDLYLEDGTPVVNFSGGISSANFAFQGCSGIQAVMLRYNMGTNQAGFYGTTSLKTVGIIDQYGNMSYTMGVADFTGYTGTIGKAGFAYSGLEKVILSPSMTMNSGSGSGTSLGSFSYCSSLVSVDFGGWGTPNATSNHDLAYAFYYCSSLETVTSIGTITTLGTDAFAYCSSLTTVGDKEGIVNFKDVTSFNGNDVFISSYSIEKMIFGEGIEITNYAFQNMSSLKALATSEEGLYVDGNPVVDLTGFTFKTATSTTYNQFANCTSIETLILGGITTLGADVFYNCSSLKTIASSASDITWGVADVSGIYMYFASFYGTAVEKVVLSSSSYLYGGTGTTTSSGVFAECKSLETVILGGLTTVGTGSFYGCTSLKQVADSEDELEYGVAEFTGKTLNPASFANTGLEKVVIDDTSTLSAASGTGATKAWAIGENEYLEEVILGLNSISTYGFYGCTSLKTLAMDEDHRMEGVINLEGIGASATYIFYGCSSITEVALGENTAIGQAAFYGCTSLVTIGDEYQVVNLCGVSMAKASFANTGMISLVVDGTSTMVQGSSFTTIADLGVFANNEKLETVDYGDYKSLHGYIFSGCTSLRSFNSADDVANLDGITTYGTSPFGGCTSLTAFELTDGGSYVVVDGILYSGSGTAIYWVPEGIGGTVSIPEGVTTVRDYAFYGNTNLTEIILPSTLTSIGSYSFAYCSSLEKVTISAGGVTVDQYAFAYCESLEYVETEGGLGTIGNYAFRNCSSLLEIEIGAEAESVGQYAFTQNTSLKTLTMHDGVTTISNYAWRQCESLESVVIPYTVTSLGGSAFAYCESLSSVIFEDIPEGYTVDDYPLTIANANNSIGTFYGCISLKEIELPERLISLGYSSATATADGYVFAESGLETVTIRGNHLNQIGTSAFRNCTSLKTVYIESGVEVIGRYMFYNCTELEYVYIADTVTEIGQYAFSGCTSLKTIIVSENVDMMGSYNGTSGGYAVFDGVGADATIYISASYKFATLNWLTYTASNIEASVETWKGSSEATYAYYLELPDDTSTLVDLGLTYWYYDANGDIVEWTVADLNI